MTLQGHEKRGVNKSLQLSSETRKWIFWLIYYVSLLNLVNTNVANCGARQDCALKYIRWSVRFKILDADTVTHTPTSTPPPAPGSP